MNHLRSKRLGSTTVETALALPILFFVIFSGWEFSRINVIRNTMDNAAYEAARESMLPGTSETKIKAKGQVVLDSVGISGATITVDPTTITTSTSEVTVDISVPFSSNSLGVAKFFTTGNMTTSMTLSRELQPGSF